MRPDPSVRSEYLAALAALCGRIQQALRTVPKAALPIRMFIAGGTAVHLHTGVRVSRDVDAAFSHRVALPDRLAIAYRDADGRAQTLYFDYQYNDTLGLLHEDANDDALTLRLDGIDPKVLEVRVLSPLDLAVSKLGRFADVDRGDIQALAAACKLRATALRKRAEAALGGYVGDVARVQSNIEAACRIVEALR
jgi:hypothetical protein